MNIICRNTIKGNIIPPDPIELVGTGSAGRRSSIAESKEKRVGGKMVAATADRQCEEAADPFNIVRLLFVHRCSHPFRSAGTFVIFVLWGGGVNRRRNWVSRIEKGMKGVEELCGCCIISFNTHQWTFLGNPENLTSGSEFSSWTIPIRSAVCLGSRPSSDRLFHLSTPWHSSISILRGSLLVYSSPKSWAMHVRDILLLLWVFFVTYPWELPTGMYFCRCTFSHVLSSVNAATSIGRIVNGSLVWVDIYQCSGSDSSVCLVRTRKGKGSHGGLGVGSRGGSWDGILSSGGGGDYSSQTTRLQRPPIHSQ